MMKVVKVSVNLDDVEIEEIVNDIIDETVKTKIKTRIKEEIEEQTSSKNIREVLERELNDPNVTKFTTNFILKNFINQKKNEKQ
jgi:hypothetical protein